MVDNFNCDRTMRKKPGFSHTPSEYCLWWNVSRLPIGLLDELLVFTAGEEAHASLLVDSSSYTYNRYEWKENAKGGRWERITVKHNALLALSGCIVASIVTDGDYSRILKKLT